LLAPVAAALAASALSVPACATEISFASFSNAPNGSFVATNSGGAGGTLTLSDTSVVNFSFLATDLAAQINGIPAAFTFSASSANSNFVDAGGLVIQSGFTGSLSFISTTAITIGSTTYAAGSNLLTATFTDADLYGKNQDALQTGDSGVGDLVYTSDFLTFGDTVSRDYSISLNAIVPALTAGLINGQPGYIQSFISTPAGTFASDPEPLLTAEVPEPATWALLQVGLGAIGLSLRQNTRRNRLAA
jgi:hypothetical protein